jgi:conjugal transfer mating pair stabilization protein TraN
VRQEGYTSFNMPLSMTYSNFTANTTTCPAGYTFAAGVCTLAANTAVPAVKVYSCPQGQVLSGISCTLTTTSAATPNYACPAGYSLSGINCVNVATVAATVASWGCPSGWTELNSDPSPLCRQYQQVGGWSGDVYIALVPTSYSCPSGYALSGASCSKTTTIVATVSYTCPAGRTLSGTACASSTVIAASWVYACNNGTLNGNTCIVGYSGRP